MCDADSRWAFIRAGPARSATRSSSKASRAIRPVTIRSLDAIHLSTALSIRRSLTSFVTYDKRLLDAAVTAGLPVASPA